jgi:hypothetical protein
MRIVSVESTDLFAGTAQRPMQLIRVTLVNEGAGMLATPAMSAAISVQGPGVRDPGPFGISDMNPGEQKAFEVPVEIVAPYQPGSTRQVTVTVTSDAGRTQAEASLTVSEPGWTMWMVSHFHYDPVWWNTQGQFTEARLALPDEDGKLPDVRSAFELVGAHLDKARRDADYKFVLAEIDYLKPYFDAFPQDREDLRRLMAEGRVEIVGGNYNEPNTNLISAEAIIRNAVYGVGFQRDVFGGDPRSAWMLDAFGHDPGYPGLMAAAGLTSSAWARGPFHQWGPSGAEGGDRRMQFSTEFEWISPDGGGLLTAYMAHHYGAGWRLHSPPDLVAAELEAYGQFRGLAQVATTRNVLLPVGSDHVIPARWVTDIHRDWNQRYVWPRFVTAVPREFFDAVRAEAGILGGARGGSGFRPPRSQRSRRGSRPGRGQGGGLPLGVSARGPAAARGGTVRREPDRAGHDHGARARGQHHGPGRGADRGLARHVQRAMAAGGPGRAQRTGRGRGADRPGRPAGHLPGPALERLSVHRQRNILRRMDRHHAGAEALGAGAWRPAAQKHPGTGRQDLPAR